MTRDVSYTCDYCGKRLPSTDGAPFMQISVLIYVSALETSGNFLKEYCSDRCREKDVGQRFIPDPEKEVAANA